ncbi:hypothetical protein GCM10023188_08850 [Pontibacter saemangeumensis]|uniref:Por secretion system C-terminal sorting domain-containing protein n=1 Tax=Pontibacter saemangeumensis TaxID=1084525 RepID=A0ABP8LDZ4_9BACT
MKIFTLYRSLICLFLLSFISLPNAKAQLVEEGVCSYEDNCIFAEFIAVQEASPTSTSLVIVLNAILAQGGPCNNIDGLIFTPVGGVPILRTRAQLAADPFVELTVNRALFTTTPDVLISSFFYISIPVFSILIPVPTDVVDLQARIDSDDPCLPITPLPVELISFDGAVKKEGVELSWSTASEQDNSHFEIERSADGKVFEQVGKVDGHGNSTTKISYRFTDHTPLTGQSYYRLRQVDFNGQHEYSKVIAVSVGADGADALQVVLAPNPCPNGNCQISIRNAVGAQETRLELTDLSGRLLYTTTVRHASNRTTVLPMQALQGYKGLYILSAVSGGKVVRQRVVLE